MTKPSWETNGFVPDQPTPSMDDKDTPSPAVRTNEEWHQDEANGFQRPGFPVYGNKKGLISD